MATTRSATTLGDNENADQYVAVVGGVFQLSDSPESVFMQA
nr:MAG TPA: hypothetical protein [Crassvirales sp.]